MSSSRRGLTLPELLLVMALMALVMLMSILSLGRGHPQAQAVAAELTAALRSARQQALSQQMRTAILLPGPRSQSWTLLAGPVRARATRTVHLGQEFPRASLLAEAGSPTPEEEAWLGPDWQALPAVIFGPQGQASGVSRISVADEAPWVVSVDPVGGVEAMADPGSVQATGEVAAPVEVAQTVNHRPKLTQIVIDPPVSASLLAEGTQAIVPYRGHLSLTVYANDPDGDPLYISWSSGDSGVFSSPGEEPMSYDGQHWVSTWQFQPYHTLAPQSTVKLTCQVRDQDGLTADDSVVSSQVSLAIGLKGRLAFWGTPQAAPVAGVGLWSCSPEAQSVKTLRPSVRDYATVSWDGSKVVYGGRNQGVCVENVDGTENTQLLLPPYGYGAYSPLGTHLAAFHLVQNSSFILPAVAQLTVQPSGEWHPDRIVVLNSQGQLEKELPVPYDLSSSPAQVTLPQLVWSADEKNLYFLWCEEKGSNLVNPRLRQLRFSDGQSKDVDWQPGVIRRVAGSPNTGEVRAMGDKELWAVRPDDPNPFQELRQWTQGGTYHLPAACSPYDGLTTILCGRAVDDPGAPLLLALWPRGTQEAKALDLHYVTPFNSVMTWTD